MTPISERPIRIGIVAGEASGDLLGAGLMQEIKALYPQATFEGIGGERMLKEGFNTFFQMERLSIMGLVEVLGRLPELLAMRRRIVDHFTATPPDLFLGIDSPDFTIGIELKLRQAGIKTAHYVSPSVWAWRQNRVFKIAKAVDLMLTLLPFEARFYREHNVPVKFVGHPLAEIIPLHPDKVAMRHELGIDASGEVIAVLPGSRGGEVSRLGPTFIETIAWLHQRRPDVRFVIPAANQARKTQIEQQLQSHGGRLPVTLIDQHSRECMMAADAILLASGTATLEAMLVKRPMVVAYKLATLSYWIMRRLLKAKYISLPNLLADKALVPELIQNDATPAKLGEALLKELNVERRRSLEDEFEGLHKLIRQNASVAAAQAVAELIEKGRVATHDAREGH
ncbi:lipid-A-disaccharide synthase [Hahella chejuensis KCTC 2396]|uniref:Lipid-A-disaccharide synthase n=1 Tax=Hahella chejuensis (strain KCTC 2396) TaxID=349521 RepID=LPXB_HAHCH|nr:lipid-A-disaccharide synthase [Hahella chejuensis]Q2SBR1.1 RecName: Full=Lipid-A-disaccharide synthase [Hahella chejuensis KCTC 2396]ABC31913.1 lipid-A-disaccharide synthase [Hahella chejuensis KCTC 2396]